MPEARAWLVEKVRAYRALGFFQSSEDRGVVTGAEPGFAHAPIGLPRPAWSRLTDAAAADLILRHHRSLDVGPFDPDEDDDAAVRVAEHDLDRMLRVDTECVGFGADAYVDVVLALGRISRGRFRPVDVRESWDHERDGPVRVTFVLDGEPREIVLDVAGDYLDEHVVEDVNMILVGQGWRYEMVETGDQTLLLVALSPRERRLLEEEHGWRFAGAPPPASLDVSVTHTPKADPPKEPAWSRWWPFRRGGK